MLILISLAVFSLSDQLPEHIRHQIDEEREAERREQERQEWEKNLCKVSLINILVV